MALNVESARKEYARLGRELSAGENDYGSIAKIGRQGKLLDCFKVVGSYLLENDPEFVTAPVTTHPAVPHSFQGMQYRLRHKLLKRKMFSQLFN